MSIKFFAFLKQNISSVKFIQNSKASIVDIESLMVVIMIFIGRQKWQMIARMAIYCKHIGDNMPNPYGNWVGSANQRSNAIGNGITYHKFERVHIAGS